jgi:hypothetical protein
MAMANLTCPHCGTANRIGSNFCNKCGTDLREEEPARPQTDKVDDSAPVEAISRAAELAAQQMRAAEPSETSASDRTDDDSDDDSDDDGADTPTDHATDRDADTDDAATPLPPLFDLGLASIAPGADDSLLLSQPWLQASADDETTTPSAEDLAASSGDRLTGLEADDPLGHARGRLVGGVQGLLDPLNITSDTSQTDDAPGEPLPVPVIDELSAQQIRNMRRIMSEEPILAAQSGQEGVAQRPSLRIPWVSWLLGLAIVLPVFGMVNEPSGAPRMWPGVEQAYAIIEALPLGAEVQIYWAYDPATSGELDLVAQPVIRHLLSRRAELTFISLLPGGPATARRTVTKSLAADLDPFEAQVAMRRITQRNFYLPGGAAVLPILGQGSEALSMPSTNSIADAADTTLPGSPLLTVIMAAHTEDVQQWLELVQTVDTKPRRRAVVAITGAGVYPMVLPYLDSGQLSGLVSGFDGASTYGQLHEEAISTDEQMAGTSQSLAQNWAHIALLFVLLIGNTVGFVNRASPMREQ